MFFFQFIFIHIIIIILFFTRALFCFLYNWEDFVFYKFSICKSCFMWFTMMFLCQIKIKKILFAVTTLKQLNSICLLYLPYEIEKIKCYNDISGSQIYKIF